MALKTVDVFKTKGRPEHTYVSVTSGEYERALAAAVESRGTLCLITGPSKTGKTTLVSKVCEQLSKEMVVVRCDNQLSSEEFWRRALEAVHFERLINGSTAKKNGAEASQKLTFGWTWLAKITGETAASIVTEKTEETSKERILSKPSPVHLIPVLVHSNALLIVEDFHYLSKEVQMTIFQQWKAFVDSEVSVVVIGTTHHACDLADANKDLIGRIFTTEMSSWLEGDLRKIIQAGSKALNVTVSEEVEKRIAAESVGLPIVTQEVAQKLFLKRGIDERCDIPTELTVSRHDLYAIFNDVAVTSYRQFKEMYDRLVAGLRRKARYKTYECLLLVFSVDPIAFRLKRDDILDRVSSLPLPDSRRPPEGSIRHSLACLKKLQDKIGHELLEWVVRDDILYIVEPTFLFYLRWRSTHGNRTDTKAYIEAFFSRDLEVSEGRSGGGRGTVTIVKGKKNPS